MPHSLCGRDTRSRHLSARRRRCEPAARRTHGRRALHRVAPRRPRAPRRHPGGGVRDHPHRSRRPRRCPAARRPPGNLVGTRPCGARAVGTRRVATSRVLDRHGRRRPCDQLRRAAVARARRRDRPRPRVRPLARAVPAGDPGVRAAPPAGHRAGRAGAHRERLRGRRSARRLRPARRAGGADLRGYRGNGRAAMPRRVRRSLGAPRTSWRWAPSSRARTCRCSCARSTLWQRRTTTRCSSSPARTGGGRRRSTTRSRRPGSARGSDGSATSPTRSAPISSQAHRCWRTPRSTRVSATRRSRPWPRACPS